MRQRLGIIAILLLLGAGGLSGTPRERSSHAGAQSPVSHPVDLETIQAGSQSHVTLQTVSGPVDVYLYAPDQQVSALQAPYCGGNEGDKEFQGHFRLISARGGKIVSQRPLHADEFFVAGHPHDGLRLFTLPGAGGSLVKIYQYGSCNIESAEFYRLSPEGSLEQVSFLDRDGRRFHSQLTGPGGGIHSSGRGESVFCSYNNFIARTLCDAYHYDGKNFMQKASWMGADPPVVWKHPTPSAQAQRALYEFLSALNSKKYQIAAYYYAGPLPMAAKSGSAATSKSDWLKAYCRAAATGCPNPQNISKSLSSGHGGEMDFTVSFVAPDFNSFQASGKSDFRFRVKKIAGGFKVLDLPPRLARARPRGR